MVRYLYNMRSEGQRSRSQRKLVGNVGCGNSNIVKFPDFVFDAR